MKTMNKNDIRYQAYIDILKEELIPAMGCTEPIALAYAAIRAAGHILALVDIDFRTGTAGAAIAHGPEIILFTHPDDALFWQACYFLPDGMRFIIVAEYRHPKLVCRQFQFAGYKFPGPGNGLTLEIIPEGKIPEHFKKCMMPRCAAHVFQIIVLSRNPQAFLAGCGPGVGSFLFAKKKLFELDHACIGKKQAGVIWRNYRSGSYNLVFVTKEKFKISTTNFIGSQHAGSRWRPVVRRAVYKFY